MDLASQMKTAARHLRKEEGSIPTQVMRHAKGIVFLTLIKGAFIWSGSISTGIVVRRIGPGKWSPPASVGMASVGFGLQAGGQKVDVIIIIGDDEEINTFCGTGQLKLGMQYGLAAGPVGRDIDMSAYIGGNGLTCSMYYSRSKGIFAGFSLDGAVLMSRWTTNNSFYESKVKVKDILYGKVQVPAYKQALVDELHSTILDFETGRLTTKIAYGSGSATQGLAQAVAVPVAKKDAEEEEREEQELLVHLSTLGESGKDLLRTTFESGSQRAVFIADHAVNESEPINQAYGIIGALTGDHAVILQGDLENGLGGTLSDYVRVRVNHQGFEREGLVSKYVLKISK